MFNFYKLRSPNLRRLFYRNWWMLWRSPWRPRQKRKVRCWPFWNPCRSLLWVKARFMAGFFLGRYLFWDFFSFFGGNFFLFLVPWSPGPLIPWCPGHLVPLHLVPSLSGPQCPGPLVPWSSGPLVPSSPGPLVLWSSGPLLLRSSGPLVLCSFSFLFF